jgi:hypothetical protein
MPKVDHSSLAKRLPHPDPRDIAVVCGAITAGIGAIGLGSIAFYVFLIVFGALVATAAVVASLR